MDQYVLSFKKKSSVFFLNQLPLPSFFKKKMKVKINELIIIYDQAIKEHSFFNTWIKKFPLSFAVQGGENIKSINFFIKSFSKLEKTIPCMSKNFHIVSIGGGSVGDFCGFLSSVWLRGLPLIHIPSTWISAMDSSHGGKTALNAQSAKNQIGSFYFPKAVLIVKNLLYESPLGGSVGEWAKVALLNRGLFYQKLQSYGDIQFCKDKKHMERKFHQVPKLFWSLLPEAIKYKYSIVKVDPLEHEGHRRILNLGHTMGHVLESHHKISHGLAVLLGLDFCVRWSYRSGFIGKVQAQRFLKFLFNYFMFDVFSSGLLRKEYLRYFAPTKEVLSPQEGKKGLNKALELTLYRHYLEISNKKKISFRKIYSLLKKDKKKDNYEDIDFIFLKNKSVFVDRVGIDSILREWDTQNRN